MSTVNVQSGKASKNPSGRQFGILLLLAVISTLWEAYVFVDLWNWFAIPLGAKVLTLRHSVGLLLIISFLRRNTKADTPKTYAYFRKAASNELSLATMFLLLGWLLHWFI